MRELAILVTARELDSQFEWAAHEAEATREGISRDIIDIILKVNGTPTASRADLRRALAGVKKGDIVTLTVLSSTPDGWQQRVVRLRAN